MYQVSDDFKSVIAKDGRKIVIKVLTGETEISGDIISVIATSRSCSTDYFEIGGVVSSYVEIEMYDPGIDLKNAEIKVSADVRLSDSSYENCPIGAYKVQRPENDDGIIRFTAYDCIYSNMTGVYTSDLEYPIEAKSVIEEIAQKTGTEIDISNLPDGIILDKRTQSVEKIVDEEGNVEAITTYVNPLDGYTYMSALGYIAMLYGCFARADKTGKVVFSKYKEIDYTVGVDRYYDDLVAGDEFTPEAILCETEDTQLISGDGNVNVRSENFLMTQDRLDAIYEQIKDLTFTPASFSFYGDPSLDPGDIIIVSDKRGNDIKVPIMSIVQEYDGGLLTRIQSFGGIESDGEIISPTDQKIDQIRTDLLNVKELVGEKASFEFVRALKATIDNLIAKKITAEDIAVDALSAISADLGTVTAGTIRSKDYAVGIAPFSSKGISIVLDGNGRIISPNFSIDEDGNIYIVGSVDATSFRVKENIDFYLDNSSDGTQISYYSNQLHLGVKNESGEDKGSTINHGYLGVTGDMNVDKDMSVGGGLAVGGSVYEDNTPLSEKYLAKSGGTITGNLNLSKGGLKMGGVQVYDRLISDTDFTYFWRATLNGNLCPYTGKTIAGTASAGAVNVGNTEAYINNLYYSGTLSKESDRRLKNDLGDLPEKEAITLLRGAKPKKFTYKSDAENVVQYGAYAQDVRDLLKTSGIGHTALLGIDLNGGDGARTKDLDYVEDEVRYSLDYEQYIPPLIVGWQNHEQLLVQMQEEVNRMREENEQLKARIAKLEGVDQ